MTTKRIELQRPTKINESRAQLYESCAAPSDVAREAPLADTTRKQDTSSRRALSPPLSPRSKVCPKCERELPIGAFASRMRRGKPLFGERYDGIQPTRRRIALEAGAFAELKAAVAKGRAPNASPTPRAGGGR